MIDEDERIERREFNKWRKRMLYAIKHPPKNPIKWSPSPEQMARLAESVKENKELLSLARRKQI